MSNLSNLAAWINSHDCATATIDGDRIAIKLEWFNPSTSESGADTVHVRTMREARAALGY